MLPPVELRDATMHADLNDFTSWRELMRREYSLTRCERLDDTPFSAKLSTQVVGPAVLGRISSSPLSYRRGPVEIRREPIDRVLVLLLLRGQFAVCQADQEAVVGPGDIVAYAQTRPFDLHIPSAYSAVTLSLPRRAIVARAFAPETMPQLASRASPNGLLAARVFAEIAAALETPGCVAGDELLEAFLDIYATATRGAEIGSSTRNPEAFIKAMKRRVMERLGDPEFDLVAMARMAGVSVRTLNRVFLTQKTTPMRWLLEQRLQYSRRLLESRHADSVTDASLRSGFKDVSHFSRAYRTMFGRTPSSVARQV